MDGKWYFLGACEPDPELNMGWFSGPVSRALLLHTKVAGDYIGEVVLDTELFSYHGRDELVKMQIRVSS